MTSCKESYLLIREYKGGPISSDIHRDTVLVGLEF